VSDPILPLLVMIVVALLALGVVARFLAFGSRQAVGLAGAGLCGLGFMLTLLALIVGQEPGRVPLPLGLPGMPLMLAFDPLATFFLLPIFLTGTASMAFAAEIADSASKSSLSGLALCLAGVVLAILAADGVVLAIGLAMASGSVWAMGEQDAGRARLLAVTGLTALAVLGATAASGFGFAAVRAHQVWPFMFYGLALAGPGALAGLAPFHAWLIPAHAASPARGAALLSGAIQPLAYYMLIRMLLDLGDPLAPGWWSVPVLATGVATAMIGGWRAAAEMDLGASLAGLAQRQSGLVAIGIGLVMVARAVDVAALGGLALAAVLMLAATQAVCGTLAQLVAGAVQAEAGSRRIVLLGGLIQSMPVVAIGMGAALFGFVALPAGAGFAAFWLLFQALLVVPHAPWFAVIAAVTAVSAALAGVALVRIFGVAFLGRPRGPRAAGAMDIARPARPAILALAGVSVAIGLFPGLFLSLADAAVHQLLGIRPDDRSALLAWGGYPVLPLLLAALAIGGAVVKLVRHSGASGPREAAAWHDGFAPAPAWLPFGDPLTQSTGAGLLPRLPAFPVLPRGRWRWRPRGAWGLPLLLAAVAMVLIALRWMGRV
jgi:formate hydrogenlyase subunit 3/multisubunit Na+/H+ antiporter MnhD subunit